MILYKNEMSLVQTLQTVAQTASFIAIAKKEAERNILPRQQLYGL
jgi:hypothetical protein